ncbi:MAG TPA: hypothetical protein VJW73_10960 [Gemmatimonadaceae bacterium]|nr:hypothetical protein [Gemmatimonadaceae bacterium]
MDADLTQALSSITGAISDLRTDMNARYDKVENRINDLRRDVFGTATDPPKPPLVDAAGNPVTPLPPPIPLAKMASSSSLEVEAHESRIINVENALKDIKAEIGDQSSAMGLYKKGLDWVLSKDGRSTIVRTVTALAAGYAALHQAGIFK